MRIRELGLPSSEGHGRNVRKAARDRGRQRSHRLRWRERASRSGGGRRRRSSRRSPRRRRGATGGSHRGRAPTPLRGDRDRVEEEEKGSSRLASPRFPGRDRLFVALLSIGSRSGSPQTIRTSHTCPIR